MMSEQKKKIASPVKIRYNTINHTAFATCDMEKTIRFWRDLLGLSIIAAMGESGNRQYFFSLTRGSYIAFFEWPDVEPVPCKHHGAPVKGPFLFDHISIGVDLLEDLFHLQDILENADFPVSDVIDHGFILSLYSYDPNGIPIEFSYNREDVELENNPIILDPSPVFPLLEGTHPVAGKWPEVEEFTPEEEWIILPGVGSGISGEKEESP